MVYQDTQESPKNPGPAGGETVLRRWFVGGKPVDCPADARIQDDATFSAADVDHMVMNLVPLPSPELVGEFADVWQLHPVLRKELLEGVPLPKLDEYGDDVFIALRSAWYNEGSHDVEFAQFHVVLRKRAILVFAYDGKWIDGTPAERVDYDLTDRFHNRKRESLFEDEHLLSNGPGAVLYRFLESVVKGYEPVMRNLSIDKEEIERQVFEGNAEVAERIYRLSEEVIELQHASGALLDVVTELSSVGITRGVDDDMREYLQEVEGRLQHTYLRATDYRAALAQVLEVNATLVAQRQNENMQKISGWAAIIVAPTIVGGVYGMNFDNMPELDWPFGYPFAIGLMFAIGLAIWTTFKIRKWM